MADVTIAAWIFVPFIAASYCFQPASGEVFTGSIDLRNTFRLEEQMVDVLAELLARTEAKLSAIRSYLNDYKSITKENTATDEDEFSERVTGNPMHAYLLMKRLYVDWPNIEQEMRNDEWRSATERLDKIIVGARFPKEEDFFEAAQTLVRLQDTYELNLTELANGTLCGRQTYAELSAQDCLYMGKHAFNAGAYARAVEWFEQSYILARLEINQTVRQDQVMECIQHAVNAHDKELERKQHQIPPPVLSDTYLFKAPLRERPALVQRNEIIRNRKYDLGKHNDVQDDANSFNALCRGEQLLDEKTITQLKCWHDNRGEPYLVLKPVKVEMHSLKPALYTFHDVLSDEEIETIKTLAKSQLARSMVQGKTGKHEASSIRTSKTAWLYEDLHPFLRKLSKRISMITRLKTDPFQDEAEDLQIANYGVGGHYLPHSDCIMKDKQDIKLNDVECGGSTAFPRIGVAVKPVRGAAAFWYNLKRSGKPDPLTLHGACPVLLGHKWVGNKWIRETAQAFNRQCTLNSTE